MEYSPRKSKLESVHSIIQITVSPNTPEPNEEFEEEIPSESSISEVGEGAGVGVIGNSKNSCHPNKTFQVGESQRENQNFPESFFSSVPKDNIPMCIDFGIQDYLCRMEEVRNNCISFFSWEYHIMNFSVFEQTVK